MKYAAQARAITLLVALFLPAVKAVATTVVAISTADRIILATDSKLSPETGQEMSGCKIVLVDSNAAAISGHLADTATNYDLAKITAQALNSPGNVLAKISTFEQDAIGPIARSLEFGRRYSPARYNRLHRGKKAVEVVFAGFIGDVPRLVVKEYFATDQIPKEAKREISVGQILIFGTHEAIGAFMKDNNSWRNLRIDDLARKLIEIEIEAHPDNVGPPISILELTTARARWISLGACLPTLSSPQ